MSFGYSSNFYSGKASGNLLFGKERDNIWLQLPVCPCVASRKLQGKYEDCDPDAKCRANYGHPPKHVLDHMLSSGYVVCCQAYIFAKFGSVQGADRSGCSRGESSCKYYHPPEHLALVVINAGRNNKRLKNEMAAKLKVAGSIQPAMQADVSVPFISAPVMSSEHSLVPNLMSQSQTLFPYQLMSSTVLPGTPTLQFPTITQGENLIPLSNTDEESSLSMMKRKRQNSARTEEKTSPEAKRRSIQHPIDDSKAHWPVSQQTAGSYYVHPLLSQLNHGLLYLQPNTQSLNLPWAYNPLTGFYTQ